jgi:CheY-like chemotaxis protein
MKKILLVDDQEDILEILQIYIEGHFQDVVTVTALGGYEAIEIIEEEDIDSIICDFRMPEGDGKVVYDFNETNTHLPFAWHSATFSDDSKKLVGFQGDETHYFVLPKPVSEDYLVETVQKMISLNEDENVTYRRVRSSILRKFTNIDINIWVSVSDKMMLINKEGDNLCQKRLEAYETKGVDFFYILCKDYDKLLSILVDQLEAKIKRCGTLEDVYFVASEIVDSFNKHLVDKGVSEDQIKLVDACAARCLRDLNKNESIKKLMAGVIDQTNYISSHSLLTIHLINIMNPNRDLLKDYAKAAVLHDLIIKNERLAKVHDLKSVEFDKLSPQEKEIVNNHGESIVNSIDTSELEEWIVKIIKGHHKSYEQCHEYKEKVFHIAHSISHHICHESIEEARKWLINLPELSHDDETKEIVKKVLEIFN